MTPLMNRRAALASAAAMAAALLARPLAASADTLPSGVSDADARAIQSVITRQIDAFRRDDAAAAYQFAAPNIKQSFPTAARFLDMVRGAYPPVYRPRSVQFTKLSTGGDGLVQRVELVGPDNKPVLALYSMVRDAHAGWLIAGCALVASARVTAALQPSENRAAAQPPSGS